MAKVSLHPDDAVEGGLPLDGATAAITFSRFVDDFDYNGQQAPTVGVRLDLLTEEGVPYNEGAGSPTSFRFYAVGDTDRWGVLEGGKYLDGLKGQVGPNESCNFMQFAKAAINCGVPDDVFKVGDISKLEGWSFQWGLVTVKTKEGKDRELPPAEAREGQTRRNNRNQLLVPVRLVSEPAGQGQAGGRKVGNARAAAAPAPRQAAQAPAQAAPAPVPAQASGDQEQQIADWIKGMITENPDTTTKVLQANVFKFASASKIAVPAIKGFLGDLAKMEEHGILVDEASGLVGLAEPE